MAKREAGEVRAEMSERLNSAEIEDVLSSIRRLVSEDLRPVPKVEPAPPRAVEEEPADEAGDGGAAPFQSVRGEAEAGRLVLMGEVARSLDGATEEDVAPAP